MAVDYWAAFLRRRAWMVGAVFLAVLILATALAAKEYRNRPAVASVQVFVSATSGQGLPGPHGGRGSLEIEGHYMAQDLATVIGGSLASRDLSHLLLGQGVRITSSRIQADISSSVSGRILTVTVADSAGHDATLLARAVGTVLVDQRARYVGPAEARRSQLRPVSFTDASRADGGHIAVMWLVRLVIGAVVSLAVGLVWDYLKSGTQETGLGDGRTSVRDEPAT